MLIILTAVSIKIVYNSNIIGYAINGTSGYDIESKRENEILDSASYILESVIMNIDSENDNKRIKKL